jgi:transmembrane sensor
MTDLERDLDRGSERELARVAQRLAAAQDRQLVQRQDEAAPPSTGFGEHLLRRSQARRRSRQVGVAATVAVLLGAFAVAGLRLWPSQDTATVATVRAQSGQRVEARLLDLALAFEDGSRVVLSSGGSLRTEAIGRSSAELALERGRVHVHVVHTGATHWMVRAGQYAIAVTGTRFRVDWQPDRGAFSVVVEEGSVRVTGGPLAAAVDIRAGQSLALENGHASGSLSSVPVPIAPTLPSAAVPAREPEREPALAPPAPSQAAAPSVHRAPSRRAAVPSWREQAAAGRYREAFAEAEREGFEGICREAGSGDLLTLAEAARYAGRPEHAQRALDAVRTRFGRSEDAAMAAFVLGRLAAENRRDYPDAAHWFRTYLVERPGGRLNREAEGRLLESLAFMDRNTARAAARTYLERYPTGPHAAFARNLVGP